MGGGVSLDQQVPLREPSAGRLRAPLRTRMGAAGVDLVVVAAVCAFLPQPFSPAVPIVLFVVYQGLATWRLRASLGKALLGLRVVRLEGEVTLAWALLRAGPGYLVLTVFGLGWLAAALPPDRRPLHDRVLGSDVILVEAASVRPRQAAVRLSRWARERESVAKRRGDHAALAVLWAWLVGLGAAVQRVIDWFRDGAASGPSVAGTMSGAAKVWVVSGASLVVGVVLSPVPPLQDVAEWIVTPRTWIGAAPAQGPTPEEARLALQVWVADAVGRPDAQVPWCGESSNGLWCVRRESLQDLPFAALSYGDAGRALLDAAGFQDSGVACLGFEIVGNPGAWAAKQGGPFCSD